MEIVLLEDVKALGKKGQIVTVNDGYARNFILQMCIRDRYLPVPYNRKGKGAYGHAGGGKADCGISGLPDADGNPGI